MSSSKVFRDDSSFTPITLIRQEIDPDRKQQIIHPVKGKNTEPETDGQQTINTQSDPLLDTVNTENAATSPLDPETVDVVTLELKAYERGKKDALTEAETELLSTLRAFNTACQKIDTLRRTLLMQNRSDIINLVIALTKKIIGRELETNRDAIAFTLENTLENAIPSDEYHVTLHPEDLEAAEKIGPRLITSIRGLEHLVFHTDPGLTRGGCLLESHICTVEATIEHQLETAKEFLAESMIKNDGAKSSQAEQSEE